jgi:hypothetical protein
VRNDNVEGLNCPEGEDGMGGGGAWLAVFALVV